MELMSAVGKKTKQIMSLHSSTLGIGHFTRITMWLMAQELALLRFTVFVVYPGFNLVSTNYIINYYMHSASWLGLSGFAERFEQTQAALVETC